MNDHSRSDTCTLHTYEYYYIKYYQQVVRYITKKVSSPAVAEDITMDVFVTCWEKFSSFNPQRSTFATWLYVIVANKLKNYYRDRKDLEEIEENFSIEDRFEDSLLAAEYLGMMRKELCAALKTLQPLQQEIVVRKYFQEMNSNEIAEKVGLSPGNVRVQLSRALKKLKAHFELKNIRWE